MVIMASQLSFMFQRINIKMSPRSSTPCRDTTKARPTSGKEKEQSQGSLVVHQLSVMLRKDISAKLRVPISKQSRGKEIPTSSSKQARQSSTVRVIEEMGRELKTTISTCTRNEVFLPESWSVLNR
jgi:hypothetical protein